MGSGPTFVRVVARQHRARVVPQRRRLRPARDRGAGQAVGARALARAGTAVSTGARTGSRASGPVRSRRRRSWCSPRTARAGARSRAARSAASRRPGWSSRARSRGSRRARRCTACCGGRPTSRPRASTRPLLVLVHGGPTGQALGRLDAAGAGLRAAGLDACCSPTTAARPATGARTRRRSPGTGASATSPTSRPASATPTRKAGPTPARVAIMGGSAGGMTALLVAAQHPDLVHAVVALYPVCDLLDLSGDHAPIRVGLHVPTGRAAARGRRRRTATVRRVTRAGRDPRAGAAVARRRRHVGSGRAVGGDRRRVARARVSPVERHVYAGEGHGWRRAETIADDLDRVDAFLTRWVLPR